MRPTCLLPKSLPEAAEAALDREFDVVRLWTEKDPEAALARVAPQLRFGIASGHWRWDRAFLGRFPRLEIVGNYGVGYDTVDVAAAAERGVVVTNTPDVLNDEVADTTIALLLAAIRRIPQADRFVRAGTWTERPFPLTPTLIGRMVGIVGFGRIGRTIARRLEAFAIRGICYHARRPRPDVPYPYYENLVDMARDCDVLIAIVPGGAETRRLIDRDVIEALGPGGCFVNVARGSVVDEAALIECLKTGKLGMAGLDVFEHEPQVPEALRQLDNVVLAPHVGSATHHTRDAMGLLVVDNLAAWKEGRPPLTPVPETPVPEARRTA
jgi:lactate dehydrogenase-like 2-hydroxyacid dehydrogenase